MNKRCCNYDCNQGRECPYRNKSNLPNLLGIIAIGSCVFWVVLLWMLI